jgi:MFS transporter, SP family, xylose:H+ symportor
MSAPTAAPAKPSTSVSFYLIGCALVAALGGLLFGFDTAVISGTDGWLKPGFVKDMALQLYPNLPGFLPHVIRGTFDNFHEFMWGFTVASALIGTVIGSLIVGRPADALGRRAVLFILALLYVTTALGCALAGSWTVFTLFRFLGGLAVGGASVVSPMYIAEISPASYRGRLVAFTQFNIVFGILLAYLSNWIIGQIAVAHGGLSEVYYRWMFGVMAFPAAAFFVLLFFTPQSPRWLVARQQLAEARQVLEKCGSDVGNVDDEIRAIQNSLDVAHHKVTEPFFCRKYATPIGLAVAIAMFNQLSGINVVIYYTGAIFKMAHADTATALQQSVIVGITNLIFTIAAMAIIDHFGRKRLMLVGSLGYIVSLAGIAYAFYAKQSGWYVLVGMLVFVASHAFGQGAVIWVFISEIFPNRVRARGQALGSFTHWIMAAVISWTFPMIAAKAGWMAFAFYACCMVVQLVWVALVMPETKGISLEDMQRKFGID